MSKVGRRAVRAARPVAAKLKPVAAILPPIAELAADLNESLRDTGAVEGLQLYMFYGAGAQARFDQFSHILPSYQIAATASSTRAPSPAAAHFGDARRRASRRRNASDFPRARNSLATRAGRGGRSGDSYPASRFRQRRA